MNIEAFEKDNINNELNDEIIVKEDPSYLQEPLDLAEPEETDEDIGCRRFYLGRPSKKFVIITSAASLVLAVLIGVSVFFVNSWRSGERATPSFLQDNDFINTGKYFEGMSINGVSIAGLTKSETEKKAAKIEKSLTEEFSLSVNANGKTEVLTEESFNFAYTTADVLDEAEQYRQDIINGKSEIAPKDFVIKRVLIEDSVDLAVDNLAMTLNVVAINSEVANLNGSYYYSEGQKGSEIDKDDLRKRIIEFINSGQETGTIDAVVTEIEPITINAQDETGEVTVLATFSTTSTNTANGNHNMALALKSCDGSIIKPGETWSFNAHTGNSNLESLGYKPATVISGGQYTTGIGGGICQVSTTIYNAALYAGLEITERHCHYWASSYAKAGFDATIDYPRLDLKLKNSGDSAVYLKCSMSGNKLTVTIFGHKSDEYDTIKLNSKTTEYVDGNYYRVAATRTFYKNGAAVKTENLTSSRYSLKKATTASGSSTTDSSSSQVSSSSTPSQTTPSQATPSNPTPSQSTPSQAPPSKPTPSESAPSQSQSQESGSSSEATDSSAPQVTEPDSSDVTTP